jgi:hypothetical protein
MTTTAAARTGSRTRWCALVSGWTGLAANVLLVLFFALGQASGDGPAGFGWLGSANDWLVAVQFGFLAPVAAAVGRRLPPSRWRSAVPAAGVAAMTAVVVLQLLLVLDVLPFERQVVLVVAAIVLVHLWLLLVNLLGHRTATLPRAVTRAGLLIGAAQPLGGVLVAAALLVPDPVREVLLVPGLAAGGAGWLALPVWPLLVARSVPPEVPS